MQSTYSAIAVAVAVGMGAHILLQSRHAVASGLYRVVRLNFTTEIEVFYMLL